MNWMKKIALFRELSIWHPVRLGKLSVNMNFRQFLGVICTKNLCESGILRYPWGPHKIFCLYPRELPTVLKESSLLGNNDSELANNLALKNLMISSIQASAAKSHTSIFSRLKRS